LAKADTAFQAHPLVNRLNLAAWLPKPMPTSWLAGNGHEKIALITMR
jgi:hypothetical protein